DQHTIRTRSQRRFAANTARVLDQRVDAPLPGWITPVGRRGIVLLHNSAFSVDDVRKDVIVGLKWRVRAPVQRQVHGLRVCAGMQVLKEDVLAKSPARGNSAFR